MPKPVREGAAVVRLFVARPDDLRSATRVLRRCKRDRHLTVRRRECDGGRFHGRHQDCYGRTARRTRLARVVEPDNDRTLRDRDRASGVRRTRRRDCRIGRRKNVDHRADAWSKTVLQDNVHCASTHRNQTVDAIARERREINRANDVVAKNADAKYTSVHVLLHAQRITRYRLGRSRNDAHIRRVECPPERKVTLRQHDLNVRTQCASSLMQRREVATDNARRCNCDERGKNPREHNPRRTMQRLSSLVNAQCAREQTRGRQEEVTRAYRPRFVCGSAWE